MKVYIVWWLEFHAHNMFDADEWHILGVFHTLDKAEKAMKDTPWFKDEMDPSHRRIEEVEVQ